MKRAFLLAIWFLYPDGVDDPLQFRDIVRIFSIGWLESAMARGAADQVAEELALYREMTAPEWMPDASWQWWSGEVVS